MENSERDGNTRPPNLPLVRNLYAGQEATVRTGHGKADRFQIGKGVRQGYCYSALKKKKKKDILTYVTSMNLDSVMLSEINQIHKTNTDWFYFYEALRSIKDVNELKPLTLYIKALNIMNSLYQVTKVQSADERNHRRCKQIEIYYVN